MISSVHDARRTGRRTRAALVGAIVTAGLAVPASSAIATSGDAEPKSGGSLTYAWNTEARLLDPIAAAARSTDDGIMAFPIFDSLMLTEHSTRVTEPHLAESLESDDNVVWMLGLRPDVTFHDGTPLDAEAVKFNWDRYLAEATQPSPSSQIIDTVEVVDDLTVSITLTEPMPLFPEALGGLNFIGSPTAIEELGDQFGNQPVGAGPFVFDEWSRGSHLRLQRNPDYWDEGLPYLDTLTITPMPDPSARVNALLAGDVDVAGIAPLDIERAVDAGFQEVENPNSPPFGGGGLIVNAAQPPFDDRDTRCAIISAIDFDRMNDDLAGGLGINDRSFFHVGPVHSDERTFVPYDPEFSQQVFDDLAEAGTPLEVDLDALDIQVVEAEYYQTQVSGYDNLEFNIEVFAVPDLVAQRRAGDFAIAALGLGTGDIPAAVMLYDEYHTRDGTPNPGTGYGTEELDALLEEARDATDEDARNEALAAIEQTIIDECLYRRTPTTQLGPPYAITELQGWHRATASIRFDEVWLDS